MGDSRMSDDLKILKIRLYWALLHKPEQELTDPEINVMYELSFDLDIRDVLQSQARRKKG
jgi:hypothetical protein